jgi:hypothetical protein
MYEHGLWFHRDIGSSSHGHLPQTIVALVLQFPAGLTAAELGQRLRLDPRSFLWQFHQHPSLQRDKLGGLSVYFAADPALATRQKVFRSRMVKQLEPLLLRAVQGAVIDNGRWLGSTPPCHGKSS